MGRGMRRKLPPLTHTFSNDSKRERKWQMRRENEKKGEMRNEKKEKKSKKEGIKENNS